MKEFDNQRYLTAKAKVKIFAKIVAAGRFLFRAAIAIDTGFDYK
jgi:hypothetical protein